jgi:hypothetical protein
MAADRASILSALSEHRDEIRQRFGVATLSVFGSAARDELRETSDVDVLVEFRTRATFDAYMDLKEYLEALLDRPVDLVTPSAVKPRMRATVEREHVRVA